MLTKRIYLFAGTQYCRFDVKSFSVNTLQYPADIATWWTGLPQAQIDAVINWGVNRLYFFVGPLYYRWNVLADQVDADYPKPIAGNWSGFTGTGFETGIDAAVNWGNGKAFFFKDDRYLRMDWNTATVDPGYPKSIGQFWPGLAAAGFDRDIDDVVNLGNGKVYFFKGSDYLRYDIAGNAVDPDYPKPIGPEWPGVFPGGISAATEWPIAHVDDNGGFRVPLNMSGCRVVAAGLVNGVAVNHGGQQFQMDVDFVDTEYPMSKSVGEYRQLARGRGTLNGHIIAHGMPNPVAGGPALPMNDRADAAGNPGTFLEDGLVAPPAGSNVFYGHRLALPGNVDASDRYGPAAGGDRIRDGDYHGIDAPGVTAPPGSAFSLNADFVGLAVDSANPPPTVLGQLVKSGEVLTSVQWSVDCAGVL